MAVGYRAILRLEPGNAAVVTAEQQLRSWLSDKANGRRATLNVADWDGDGSHVLGESAELVVVHDDHVEDGSQRRLYRLVETNSAGTWAVSLYAASLPQSRSDQQTIVVEVDRVGADTESALADTDPPRVVGMLLETVNAHDGRTPLTAQPIFVRPGDTAQVVEAILDTERTSSVIVAGSLGREHDEAWREVVASLTRYSIGTAATFVVRADAMEEFEAALPDALRVGAGRVRTFLPGVDPDDPTDGFRHKWLGPATLQRSLSASRRVARPLQIRHGLAARRRLVEMELPPDVRRTLDVLRRAETAVDRDARVAARLQETQTVVAATEPVGVSPQDSSGRSNTREGRARDETTKSAASAGWARLTSTLRRWLRVTEPTVEHLDDLDAYVEKNVTALAVAEEQILEAAAQAEQLEQDLRALRRRVEDMELDLAQAEEDEVSSQRELAVLRQRLAASANPTDSYVAPLDSVWSAPESVEELLQRMTAGTGQHLVFDRVEFTGDEDAALEIDRRYVTGLYAKTLWQYVRVLYDYVGAVQSGFNGSVHMYLTDDRVMGEKCSTSRHAATESESVLNNVSWRAERVLPVPTSIDASGKALMDAHFKPTHRDTFAPRMHYLDDSKKSGKVYVGYIGRHLTNKKS